MWLPFKLHCDFVCIPIGLLISTFSISRNLSDSKYCYYQDDDDDDVDKMIQDDDDEYSWKFMKVGNQGASMFSINDVTSSTLDRRPHSLSSSSPSSSSSSPSSSKEYKINRVDFQKKKKLKALKIIFSFSTLSGCCNTNVCNADSVSTSLLICMNPTFCQWCSQCIAVKWSSFLEVNLMENNV